MIKKTLCAIMAFCMLFTMVGITTALAADVTITVTVADDLITYTKGTTTLGDNDVIALTVSFDGSRTIKRIEGLKITFDSSKAKVLTKDNGTIVFDKKTWNINNATGVDFGDDFVMINAATLTAGAQSGEVCKLYIQMKDTALTPGNVLDLALDTTELAATSSTTAGSGTYDVVANLSKNAFTIPDNRPTMDVTVNDVTVEYDGTVKDFAVTGAPADSTVSVKSNGNDFEGAVDAGTYPITVEITHDDYRTFTKNVNLIIEPKEITIADFDAVDRVYDGSTTVEISGNLSGVVAGDDVSIPATATISSKNVGTYTVAAPTLSGEDASNYTLNASNADVVISAKSVTASVIGVNKVYDATTAFVATATLEGVVDGDVVETSAVGTLTSKNAGSYTDGNAVVTLEGTDAANYVLAEDTFNDIEVEISPKEIIASVDGTDREYDATTTFEATATLDGVIDGDVVNSYCEEDELDSKNVGTRVGSVVVLITGEDAANYTLATSTFDNVTVEISPKEITASVTGTDKTYDATTAFVATATLEGVIDGDVVETSAVGTLTSKNAGSYTDGNAVVTLEGTDAANYVLAEDTFNDVAVTVTAKDVTATVTATNREYDATTAFVATATLDGVIDGDVVETTATGSLTSKNAGEHTDATVAVTINGADAANYNLTNPTVADVAVTISAKALTVTGVTAKNRKADGTTVVEIDSTNKVVTGVINEDIVTVNVPATGSIESAAAGSDKVVTITGITLEGADAANYTVTAPTDVTVNISSAGSGNYRPSYSVGGSSSSTVTPPADDKKDEEVKDEEVKDDEIKDEEVKDLTKATADVSLKEKASEIKFVETDEEGNFYPDAEATRDDVVNALNEVLDIENATGDCELKDIENAENAEIVELFTKANIIAGYEDGTFRGTDSITRAEFVKVLAVALGVEIKDFEEDKFDDLAGHWSVDYVNSFVELGYIIGYPDGTFRPDARISKAEMVIVINRAIGKDVDASDNIDVEIADIDDAHWAYKYIKAAVK